MFSFTRPQIPDVMPGTCPYLNPTSESPGHHWLIHPPVYSRTAIHVHSVESRPQVTYRYKVNTSGFREGQHEFMFSYPALKPLYRPSLPNAMMTCAWEDRNIQDHGSYISSKGRQREHGRLSSANTVEWAESTERKATEI